MPAGYQHQWKQVALLVLAPAVTVNIWCGQNGFLTAALLVGGLAQLERRPLLSGALFGLLSVKPQLGVLLPVMLVLTGRWRTIIAAMITIAALLMLTTLWFGSTVWTAYVNDAMPVQGKVFLRDYENFMTHMPTAFMNARVAGLSLPTAALWQSLLSLASIIAVIWTFRRRRDADLSNAVLVTGTFLVTPYAFNYDMVVFSWVMIKLNDRSDNTTWDYALMLAVWTVPFLTVPLGIAGLPVSVLPMLAFGARVLWRMTSSQTALGKRLHAGTTPQFGAAM
jgi:hypothetical protein